MRTNGADREIVLAISRSCVHALQRATRTMPDVQTRRTPSSSHWVAGMLDALGLGMYSKARIAGHPIHPMLIALPIGLYVSTVAAMLAFVATEDPFFYRAAMYAGLGGVGAAVLAAIPGAVDLFALPGRTRVRRTAIKHASLALLATGLFAISAALLYRGWDAATLEVAAPLAVALAGLVTLVIAGALGWALVQTHHVGVKPIVVRDRSRSARPHAEEYDDFSTPPVGHQAIGRPAGRSMRH